jgi:hypothetical protein
MCAISGDIALDHSMTLGKSSEAWRVPRRGQVAVQHYFINLWADIEEAIQMFVKHVKTQD